MLRRFDSRDVIMNLNYIARTLNTKKILYLSEMFPSATGWIELFTLQRLTRFQGELTILNKGGQICPFLVKYGISIGWDPQIDFNFSVTKLYTLPEHINLFDKIAFYADLETDDHPTGGDNCKIFLHYSQQTQLFIKILLSSIAHNNINITGYRFISENDIQNHINSKIINLNSLSTSSLDEKKKRADI